MTTPKPDLTLQPSHVKVFGFVKAFIGANVFSPTHQEIAAGTGLTERQVYRLVEDMVEAGFFRRKLRQTRSLKIRKDIAQS